jgi:hypothetical protein
MSDEVIIHPSHTSRKFMTTKLKKTQSKTLTQTLKKSKEMVKKTTRL